MSNWTRGSYRKFLCCLILSSFIGLHSARQGRILGGTEVENGQFPFAVYLKKDTLFCTGSIISSRLILTAAHCVISKDGSVHNSEDLKGFIGDVDNAKGTEISFDQIKINPRYDRSKRDDGKPTYDVAILRTTKPIIFSDNVRPLCLSSTLEYETAKAIGWGATVPDEDAKGSDVLRYVSLKIINPDTDDTQMCKKYYATFPYEFLCAYGYTKGIYNGDSGGPLVANTKDGFVQVGVMTGSPADNDAEHKITYSAKIHNLLSFIKEQGDSEICYK